MTLDITKFTPVDGEANQWLYEDGNMYVARDGQPLADLIAEIEADAANPPPPVISPLDPYQFMQVVAAAFPPSNNLDLLSGLKDIIVSSITDQGERFRALAMLQAPPGGLYFITDPLFSNPALLAATGKTPDDIAAMWQAGLAL